MATYINRKGRITAQVCLRPLPSKARTFGTMQEAVEWAAETEWYMRAVRKNGSNCVPVPVTLADVLNMPRVKDSAFQGVYFLFDRGQCVYVGQSGNVHARIKSHRLAKLEFESYAWFPCLEAEMTLYEQYFIKLIDPPFNIAETERAPTNRLKEARQLKATG